MAYVLEKAYISMEKKVISSGKKEKIGCSAVKTKNQATPKQKNYPSYKLFLAVLLSCR